MSLCDRNGVILRQIEQGAHYIGKSLMYSMRKVFLECSVVELVYKFDEKSYRECLTRRVSIAKKSTIQFFFVHKLIYL